MLVGENAGFISQDQERMNKSSEDLRLLLGMTYRVAFGARRLCGEELRIRKIMSPGKLTGRGVGSGKGADAVNCGDEFASRDGRIGNV